MSRTRWLGAYVPAKVKPLFRWILRWRRLTGPALFVWSFVLLIALGTAGLMLIEDLQAGPRLGFVDALFTITSAVCVTGLAVVDLSTHFTTTGQAWILLFVQLGGIGLISLTTLLIGAMGQRLSLRSEMLAVAPTRRHDRPEVWELTLAVTRFSLVVEAIGAVLLWAVWSFRMPVDEAAWHAVFHSVSAYCNAGMSTFSTSLIGLQDSSFTLWIISFLVIAGGIGYLTFEELTRWFRASRARRDGLRIRLAGAPQRLSSHTWAVVVTSAVLLLAGWILFALFEWSDTLSQLGVVDKLSNAWFMSVTPRSAGFNTVDYTHVGNDTAALTMMLMLIGGSPGSTAGGLKTTTIAVLVALGLSRFRGRRYVAIQDRAIPQGTVERAVGIVLLALFVLAISFFTINAIEAVGMDSTEARGHFLPIMFESVSAFATAGLSMNYTAELELPSKLLVALTMFIGRVGLFSFFTAVMLRRAQPPAFQRPAQEDVIVG